MANLQAAANQHPIPKDAWGGETCLLSAKDVSSRVGFWRFSKALC